MTDKSKGYSGLTKPSQGRQTTLFQTWGYEGNNASQVNLVFGILYLKGLLRQNKKAFYLKSVVSYFLKETNFALTKI